MVTLGLLLLLQESPATVTGTVRLGHRAPAPRKVSVDPEPLADAIYPGGVDLDELVVDADNRLAAVLVYVKQAARIPSASGGPVNLTFLGFQLRPRVITLRVEQELLVTNKDGALHNLHVLAFGNKESNVGLPNPGDADRRKYPTPEVGMKAKCDVHPWEYSWVHVFDHPYYSLTGTNGRFTLPGLPPGRYTLGVWHERCKPREVEIEVKAGESQTLDLFLETEEGPPPFPWLKVGVGGGAVLVLALAGLLLVGRRRTPSSARQVLSK